MAKPVTGFSKKTKTEKIDWLTQTYLSANPTAKQTLQKY